MRNWLRVAALVIAVVMSFALFGCAKQETKPEGTTQAATTGEATPTPEPVKEKVTLTLGGNGIVITVAGVTAGVQEDEVAKEIERITGVTIDLIDPNPTAEKWNTLLASGDLPDVIMGSPADIKAYVEGNHIKPLDELVQQYGKAILSETPFKIQYAKDNLSNGTGKLYAIPAWDSETVSKNYAYDNIAPVIRWDYYKELGYPAYETYDDLLVILKQMQDKHPKNENGKKVYGLSGWSDWVLWYYNTFGLMEMYGGIAGIKDPKIDGTYEKIFDDFRDPQAGTWTQARWLNKAYNMGVLDPETFTQKNENFLAKIKDNRVLMTFGAWAGANEVNAAFEAAGQPEKGFMALPPAKGGYRFDGGFPNKFGARFYSISSNCKTPERAMELIDYICSLDGSELIYNGIKDKHWTIVDGRPELTDETANKLSTDPNFVATSGITKYINFVGRFNGTIDPRYNCDIAFNTSTKSFAKRATKVLDKDFCAHYGVSYPGEAVDKMVEKGEAKLFHYFIPPFNNPAPPAEVTKAYTDASDVLFKALPKVIMAKTPEEFDALMKKTIEDIDKKGYQAYFDFMKADIEQNFAKYKSYIGN